MTAATERPTLSCSTSLECPGVSRPPGIQVQSPPPTQRGWARWIRRRAGSKGAAQKLGGGGGGSPAHPAPRRKPDLSCAGSRDRNLNRPGPTPLTCAGKQGPESGAGSERVWSFVLRSRVCRDTWPLWPYIRPSVWRPGHRSIRGWPGPRAPPHCRGAQCFPALPCTYTR